jgi:hypothetical protein
MTMSVLCFFSIHIFSKYHLITSVRRAKLQNEVSYVLDHMGVNIARATGYTMDYPVSFLSPDLRVRVNSGNFIAYHYDSGQHLLQYCPDYNNATSSCNTGYENLSRYLTSSLAAPNVTISNTRNYLFVSMSACWDQDSAITCGDQENPTVTMTSTVKMPSVSAR